MASLSNKVRVLSAVNSSREGQKQLRHTECEHMDIANQCPVTLRMTVLCAQGATNSFRASQSNLTMHSTVAKAAATRSHRYSQLMHDLLLFVAGSRDVFENSVLDPSAFKDTEHSFRCVCLSSFVQFTVRIAQVA